MRHIIYILSIILFVGCGQVKYITLPSKEETIYNYKDSIITRDSTIIIEKQIYKDYTDLLDTLILKSTYSYAKSYVDTSKMLLSGELIQEPIKTRYLTKTETVYRDSLVYKEIPVQVEIEKPVKYVPRLYKVSFYWLLFSIFMLIAFIFTKFKDFF